MNYDHNGMTWAYETLGIFSPKPFLSKIEKVVEAYESKMMEILTEYKQNDGQEKLKEVEKIRVAFKRITAIYKKDFQEYQDKMQQKLQQQQMQSENNSIEAKLNINLESINQNKISKQFCMPFHIVQQDGMIQHFSKNVKIALESAIKDTEVKSDKPNNQSSIVAINSIIIQNSRATLGNINIQSILEKEDKTTEIIRSIDQKFSTIAAIRRNNNRKLFKRPRPRTQASTFPNVRNKHEEIELLFDFTFENDPIRSQTAKHCIGVKLENISSGCTKRLVVSKKIINHNGEEKYDNTILSLDIEPGLKDYPQITIPIKAKGNNGFKEFNNEEESLLVGEEISESRFQQNCNVSNLNNYNDALLFQSIDGEMIDEYEMQRSNNQVTIELPIELENIFHGKKFRKLLKTKMHNSNQKQMFWLKVVTIVVRPGTKAGTPFLFEKTGSNSLENDFSDVIFVARDARHSLFVRKEIDIFYYTNFPYDQLKNDKYCQIPTLDGDNIMFYWRHLIYDGFKDGGFIENRGLPYPDDPSKRGNLIFMFDVTKESQHNEATNQSSERVFQKASRLSSNKSSELSHNKSLEPFSIESPEFPSKEASCSKTHQVFDLYSKSTKQEENLLQIDMLPGTKTGKKLRFPMEGDQQQGQDPSDIIFTTTDESHQKFVRDELDLLYTAKIYQYQTEAVGDRIRVQTVDMKKPVYYKIEKPISEFFVRRLEGLGLPSIEDVNSRGDIVLRFEIIDSADKDLQDEQLPQDPPIVFEIYVTLVDILDYYFVTRRLVQTHMTMDGIKEEVKPVHITLKPGVNDGTTFEFPRGGHRTNGKIPSNIIFKILIEPHEHFIRARADLEYVVQIPSSKVGQKFNIKVPTLEGKEIDFTVDENVTPNCRRIIEGYGLPREDNPKKRGNILVKFSIYEETFFGKIGRILSFRK